MKVEVNAAKLKSNKQPSGENLDVLWQLYGIAFNIDGTDAALSVQIMQICNLDIHPAP